MSRAWVGIVGTVVVAAGLGFWALRADKDGDGGEATSPRTGTAAAAPRTGTATPANAAAGRARSATNDPAEKADDTRAIAGVVTTADGKPVAGATVECFRDAAGLDERTARIREAVGDLFEDRDIEILARQFGVNEDPMTPDQAARAAQMGQRLSSRLVADPSALNRVIRLGRDAAIGLERDAQLPRVGSVTTGADGAFRFDRLERAGGAELRVSAPRYVRRKVRAKPGDLAVKVELARAGIVVGEVRAEGRPLAGADVAFRTGSVRTGEDGRFRWEGARPPKEPVLVTAAGYVARGVWAPVALDTEPAALVIELDPAGSITGRVTSQAGSPVAGASITFPPDMAGLMQMMMPGLGGDSVPTPLPTATTAPDGTYRLDGVPARSVRVRADADGHLGAQSESVRVPARGVAENVDFVLSRESVLFGRITAADGTAVADAEVQVEVPGTDGIARMAAMAMGGVQRTARSGGDGAYRVRGLPGGTRNVTVEAAGFRRVKESLSLSAEASTQHDFVLQPGFRVSGQVIDAKGNAVPGSTVSVAEPATGRPGNPMMQMFALRKNGVSGADGAFVVTGLEEGPYDVTAAAPGHIETTVRGVATGAEGVLLQLGEAAIIQGVVVSETDGSPVAGATVHRRLQGSRAPTNPMAAMLQRDPLVMTDTSGAFAMTDVVPGAYEVYVRARGFADSPKVRIQAAPGAAGEALKIALAPGSSLGGRVVRKSDGTPVAGAVVWVRPESASPFTPPNAADILGDTPSAPDGTVSAKTGDDGTFLLTGLTPGAVTLETRAAGFAPKTSARTDVPSATVVVEMSEGGALEGVVYDAAGVGAEGQTVIVQQGMMGTGTVRTATSGRGGSYRIDRIPPGSYTALFLDSESAMGMGGMATVAIRDGEVTRHDFGKRAPGAPLEGSVVADGKPLEGATVVVIGGPAGFKAAATDEKGAFRFDHLDAGEYQVMVQTGAMGGGSEAQKVTVGADGSVATVRFELSALVVEGMVVDAATDAPIGFAQVVLLAPGGGGSASLSDMIARQRGQALTGADGRFRIEGVPKGTFSLRATASGYVESAMDGVSGGGAPVRVRMARGLELVVTVHGPDDRPVEGASVIPEDASGREGLPIDFSMQKTTGADGVARLRLQAARYVIHVRATGFPVTSVPVDGSAGTLSIQLEAGGALDVRVTSAGAAVANAAVKVLDASGAEMREALTISSIFGSGGTTGPDGRARREGLRAGKVTVVVTPPGGRPIEREAVIAAGQTTTVSIAVE